MIVRKSDGVYSQSVAANQWSFTVPEERTNIELIGIFSEDGRTSITFDSYTLTDGVVTVFFGIDEVSGVIRYEYDIESSESSTSITGEGGTINMTVHQYNNGGTTSQQ